MAKLTRPNGVEIHWDERGEGPLVVIATQFFGYPEIYEGLISDLARDHRAVTYHLRGTGESSRQGPYSIAMDAEDLAALIEAQGEPAVVIGMADGCNRAIKVAVEAPGLVPAVVTSGGNPVGLTAAAGTDSLAGSPAVIEALINMMEVDYRGALYTMVRNANPDEDDDWVRERVSRTAAHCPQEAAAPRLRSWVTDEIGDDARAIGGRLWMLEAGGTPWFHADTLVATRELLPDAHIEEVADGVLSRPDILASVVRDRIVARERTASASGGGDQTV